MSGSDITTDVGLDVDGGPVFRAFDQIEARMKTIQGQVDAIMGRAKAAAEAFGGANLKQIRDLEKVMSTLDKFDANIKKNSPTLQSDKAWQDRQKQLAAEAAAKRKIADDEAKAIRQRNADEEKRARQEASAWARREREMLSTEQKAARLAEQRIKTEIAGFERQQRERETALRREAQLREQNNVKMMRDVARQQVEEARGVRELEAIRKSSAENIATLRGQRGTGSEEERRKALLMLEIERDRLRLAEARIRLLNSATDRSTKAEAGVDGRLDIRGARLQERALAQQLDLNLAKTRQSDIEGRIERLMAARGAATLREKLEIEQSLKIEDARLKVTAARVRQLEAAARAEAMANRPSAGGAPKGPPALFGANGITGVVARTAAYGGAAQVLFGVQAAMMSAGAFEIEFEDRLAKLAAVANATQPEMAQLRDTILGIGESSRFSLTDITEMAEKLAQAGVSVGGMKDALGAVTTLANASGSTPAEAVDLVTASLGAFQLQGSESARVADLMTSALNRTRLTVQQAALAIQYVGTTAYEQNISLEQLLATAGALSQAGIRSGSTIGTGMRQFLVDLQTPSEKLKTQFERLNISLADVDVKTRGLPAVLDTLKEKGFGSAQAYGALETRAAAFYLVAKNNLPIMEQLQMSFADQGAAAIANERAMNSLSAQWQRFKNILAESFDSIGGELLNAAKNILSQIASHLEEARRLAEESKDPKAPLYKRDLVSAIDSTGITDHVNRFMEVAANWALPKSTTAGEGGVGTWIRNLGRDASDATGHMAELEAAMNRTSQATAEQRDKVGALDHEIMRLITQKEALKGKTQQVTAETVNLMSRFGGLSKHITGATGDINGLIGALHELRNEEAQTLIDNISQQSGALQSRALDAQSSRDSAISRIRGNSALLNALGGNGRNALNQLGGPNGRVAADILLRVAEQLQKTNVEWAKLVNQAASNQQTIFSTQGQRGILATEKGQLEARRTEFGGFVAGNLEELSGSIDRLRSASGANKSKISADALKTISTLEKKIQDRLKLKLLDSSRQFLNDALTELGSSRAQISDIMTPTAAETAAGTKAARAADRQAQMITFGSPVAGTPHVNSGIGHRASPGGIGSTDHQGVDIRGNAGDPVYAAADGVVEFAGPRGGYGNLIIIDHGMNTTTRYGHLSVIDVTVGQEVAKGQKIGRIGTTGNSTAPHLHFERRLGKKIDRNPLSAQAPGSSADASDRAQRLQDKEDQRADREAVARERLALSNADDSLTDALKNMKYASTDALFASGEKTVDAAFNVWADQLRTTSKAELERNDATPAEAEARMKEVEKTIKQKREEVTTSIFDFFIKSIQKQLEVIDQHFKDATQPFELGVAMAQGRLNALNRQSMQGRVPDYVQQTMQRQLGVATDQLDQARSIALEARIAETQQLIEEKTKALQDNKGIWNTGQITDATTELNKLTLSVGDLNTQKAQLDASLATSGLIPLSLNDNLEMAISNYRELHNLNASFTEMLTMNLGGALDTLQGSFEGFFTDIMSGTTGVLGAFRSMAQGIIKYLIQVLAKMIAVKMMQMALNLFGGGGMFKGPIDVASGMDFSNVGSGIDFGAFAPKIYGGEVKALSGRYIRDGVPNRDSVRTKIAKGEFVTRKWAVDSVGVDFMERLNNRGAEAVRGMGGPKVVMPQPANQNMNVYVVSPDQQPSMGPNDVLVTIANDIYRGGPTKQLIKQVSQGG